MTALVGGGQPACPGDIPVAVWVRIAATVVRGALDQAGVSADEARRWLDALEAAALFTGDAVGRRDDG